MSVNQQSDTQQISMLTLSAEEQNPAPQRSAEQHLNEQQSAKEYTNNKILVPLHMTECHLDE